ncbi:hypothetical protein QYF36_007377 [Acer negundo]|nr:hypothetical protein QYF36_007377 [Acer negundo]
MERNTMTKPSLHTRPHTARQQPYRQTPSLHKASQHPDRQNLGSRTNATRTRLKDRKATTSPLTPLAIQLIETAQLAKTIQLVKTTQLFNYSPWPTLQPILMRVQLAVATQPSKQHSSLTIHHSQLFNRS